MSKANWRKEDLLPPIDSKQYKGLLNDLNKEVKFIESHRTKLKSDISVDKFMKIALDLKEEHAAISVQLTRHERWFKEIAKKTGISFEI